MKHLTAIFLLVGLSACAMQNETVKTLLDAVEVNQPTIDDVTTKAEQDLANNRDTIATLNFFNNVYGGVTSLAPRKVMCLNTLTNTSAPEKYGMLIAKTSKELPFDKKCLISLNCGPNQQVEYKDSSDECILARRNAKESLIGYFNFQKYLPEGTTIKTDEDFANVYAIYKAAYLHYLFPWGWENDEFIATYAERDCYKNKEQTKTEQEQCEEEEKQFIRDLVFAKAKACSKKYPKTYNKLKKELKNTNYMYANKDSGDAEMETKFGAVNLCVPDKIYLRTY